jgi:hypothetical protein
MHHFRLKLTTSVASALIASALPSSNGQAFVPPSTDEIYSLANNDDGVSSAFLHWYYQSRGGDGSYRDSSIEQSSPPVCGSPTGELPDVERGGFGAIADCNTAMVRE